MKKTLVIGSICLLLLGGWFCLGAWKRFADRSLGAGSFHSCCENLRKQGFELNEKRVTYGLRARSRSSLRTKSALNGLLPAGLQRRTEVLVFSRAGSSLTLDACFAFGRVVALHVSSEQATAASVQEITRLVASQNPLFRVRTDADTDEPKRGQTHDE